MANKCLAIFLSGYVPESLNVQLRTYYLNRKSHHLKPVQDALQKWWYLAGRRYKKYLPVERCEFLELEYGFKDKRKRDFDNYAGKYILDAIKGQIIKDDNCDCIGQLRITFKRGVDNPYTKIIIGLPDDPGAKNKGV